MSNPPGDRPGGDRPFEGLPPSERGDEEIHADLPDLEPEFVEALRAAEETQKGDDEPALGGAAAPGEQPTEEQPLGNPDPEPPEGDGSDPDKTVEFSAQEAAHAAGAEAEGAEATPDGDGAEQHRDGAEREGDGGAGEEAGDDERRTVVIGSEPPPPADVGPVSPHPPPPSPPGQAAAPVTAEAPPAQPPPAAAPPGIPQKPPPEGDWEPAPKRRRLWLRFVLGSFFIVASVAASVAASVLLEVKGIAEALQPIPKVKRLLQQVDGGEAQNILVLGSDKRASLKGTRGLSDTTILLRLDPDNNAIALLNIPRDLKTYIPNVGVTKFNEAYAYGGPKLTLRVVKRLTGLPINHVVNVDFLGFIRAINAIECVYIDVDRRYFNDNAGLPPSMQYAEINVQPGYQRLCGKDALDYVRYRHTDSDLVRAARQQDFLREARQRVPVSDLVLPGERDELIDIFTTHTSSDISGLTTMLDVLDLFIASRKAPIKEVDFPAILRPSFVTASQAAIDRAVQKFLGIEASGGPRGELDVPTNTGRTGIAPEERKRARRQKAQKQPKAPPTPSPGNDGLVDVSQFSRELAGKVAARTLRSFPVFYPRRLPSGSIYVQVPRVYHLRDEGKERRGAYRMVLQLPQGDYFGIQGIHGWTDPPILSQPSESRTMNGREYDIYLDGDRVRIVAWRQNDNVYWVSNSLLQTLSNAQMLGIARAVGKLPGQKTLRRAKRR